MVIELTCDKPCNVLADERHPLTMRVGSDRPNLCGKLCSTLDNVLRESTGRQFG